MLNKFRVAALSAAIAFLCAGGAAQAQQVEAAATEGQQGATVAASTVSPVRADAAVIAGRVRPDRVDPADVRPGDAVITPEGPAAAERPSGRSLVDLVALHSGSDTPDAQFECLASAVYYESRGEPLEGQLAVAEVILNRVRSGRFRATICDVVTQPSQFSFVRRGVIPQAPRSSAAWHRAVAIAHIALNELHNVTGDDSLFFHATYVRPNWGRPRIARIGNHIFYR
jgi:hypothetical protein